MSDLTFTKIITSSGAGASNTTLVATYSALIPANTFAAPGILEVQTRTLKSGTLTATSINNTRIYLNTSNSLTGATLLAYLQGSTGNTILFRQGRRQFRLIPNTNTGDGTYYLQGLAFGTNNPIDYIQNTSTLASGNTTFNPFVDNYILISVALNAASTDVAYGSFLKILYFQI